MAPAPGTHSGLRRLRQTKTVLTTLMTAAKGA